MFPIMWNLEIQEIRNPFYILSNMREFTQQTLFKIP